MKILTIVGARPQFVKAAMVSKAIVAHNKANESSSIIEEIIHTGQHYDDNMSDIFFSQMGIPAPAKNLGVGSGNHGETTAQMLVGIENEIMERHPDWVLIYGDTNSTLAGALAAAKMNIPVCHVEAGLRSFNMRMPEEVNRILADRVASLLLCPTHQAIENLKSEGVTNGVHHVGDVMYDAALQFGSMAENDSNILNELGVKTKSYYLATVHRAENTDDLNRLRGIFNAFAEIATVKCPLLLPLHPRTMGKLQEFGIEISNPNVRLISPMSFVDMVMLEKNAKLILTDSGGVQKEAYFHGVPCVTLRDETEWVETVDAGWNQIAGADKEKIISAVQMSSQGSKIGEYGAGSAATEIISTIWSMP